MPMLIGEYKTANTSELPHTKYKAVFARLRRLWLVYKQQVTTGLT